MRPGALGFRGIIDLSGYHDLTWLLQRASIRATLINWHFRWIPLILHNMNSQNSHSISSIPTVNSKFHHFPARKLNYYSPGKFKLNLSSVLNPSIIFPPKWNANVCLIVSKLCYFCFKYIPIFFSARAHAVLLRYWEINSRKVVSTIMLEKSRPKWEMLRQKQRWGYKITLSQNSRVFN